MTFYFRKLYNIYIMSNYSLQVDNSRLYDPSLRSAISSLNQRQEEAHRLADAAYGEMSAKANMLEQLANDVQGKDSVAYQNYMNYANALRQHTDMLATQGLNPSTWNNIIKAKNDYSRIISPIENAMKKREEAAKYQAEYIKQHPDAIFEREAGEMGIDQWMKNPNYVPKVIDRRALEERAKERYSALNKQLMEWVSKNGGLDAIKTKDPQAVKKWFKVNVPWLYESMYKTGVNPDDLEKLAAGDPSMQNSLLGAILNDTVRSSGVLSMNTSYDHFTDAQNRQRYQNILDKVMSSVRGASSHSIGETKFDKYDDRISADLLKQSKELAFRAAEAEKDRKWREEQAAKARAAAGAKETFDNWNLIRGNSRKSDNENGERKDEIVKSRNLLIANELPNELKKLNYSTLANAVEKLEQKGIKWKKGNDNKVFFKELVNGLTKRNSEIKEEAKQVYEKAKEWLKNHEWDLVGKTPTSMAAGEYDRVRNKIIDSKNIIDSYERGEFGEGLGKIDFTGNLESSILNTSLKYEEELLNQAGFKKQKDKNGNDVYINENGEVAREGAYNDMLDFNSDVHYTDMGTTKMDAETSKDMATLLFDMQAGQALLTEGGYGQDENGNALSKDAFWFWEDDQKDVNSWLKKAQRGEKFLNIVPDYDYKTGETHVKIGFWDNADDAENKKPQKTITVNSAIFDNDSTYTDENGNVVYTRDVMKDYIKNMDDAMKIIHNRYKTEKEREEAERIYDINNRLLFAAMNKARMAISTKARLGRSSGEGPIAEEAMAGKIAAEYQSESTNTD